MLPATAASYRCQPLLPALVPAIFAGSRCYQLSRQLLLTATAANSLLLSFAASYQLPATSAASYIYILFIYLFVKVIMGPDAL